MRSIGLWGWFIQQKSGKKRLKKEWKLMKRAWGMTGQRGNVGETDMKVGV